MTVDKKLCLTWSKKMTVSRVTTGHGQSAPGINLDFGSYDRPPAFEVGDKVIVTVQIDDPPKVRAFKARNFKACGPGDKTNPR